MMDAYGFADPGGPRAAAPGADEAQAALWLLSDGSAVDAVRWQASAFPGPGRAPEDFMSVLRDRKAWAETFLDREGAERARAEWTSATAACAAAVCRVFHLEPSDPASPPSGAAAEMLYRLLVLERREALVSALAGMILGGRKRLADEYRKMASAESMAVRQAQRLVATRDDAVVAALAADIASDLAGSAADPGEIVRAMASRWEGSLLGEACLQFLDQDGESPLLQAGPEFCKAFMAPVMDDEQGPSLLSEIRLRVLNALSTRTEEKKQ